MLKIAICDDNIIFMKSFHNVLEESFLLRKIDAEIIDYVSGSLLLNHCSFKKFDAIFLDIDMPKLSGFNIAKKLSEINSRCHVIFVTSHSELVYDSFLFKPLNFIPKNGDFKPRLEVVLNQLLENLKQDSIIILENKEIGRTSILLKDVLYIESNKHQVIYHILNQPQHINVSDSLLNLEQKYAECDFVRVHKKYIVNLRHVFNINPTKEVVIFKQKFELPMSRNYKNAVDEKLTLFLRRMRGQPDD